MRKQSKEKKTNISASFEVFILSLVVFFIYLYNIYIPYLFHHHV